MIVCDLPYGIEIRGQPENIDRDDALDSVIRTARKGREGVSAVRIDFTFDYPYASVQHFGRNIVAVGFDVHEHRGRSKQTDDFRR